jgi:hypothetical protein
VPYHESDGNIQVKICWVKAPPLKISILRSFANIDAGQDFGGKMDYLKKLEVEIIKKSFSQI